MKPNNLYPTRWTLFVLFIIFSSIGKTRSVCYDDSDCSGNGSCSELNDHADVTGGTCGCFPGFWGDACDKTCPILCQNGGYCAIAGDGHGDTGAGFICKCPANYEGQLCQRLIQTKPAGSISSSMAEGASTSNNSKFGLGFGVGALCGVAIVLAFFAIRAKCHQRKELPMSGTSSHKTTQTGGAVLEEGEGNTQSTLEHEFA